MSKTWKLLKAVASKKTGVPEEELRVLDFEAGIQACIDAAWESQEPEHRDLQNTLFPDGKPTPEQFIAVVAAVIREEIQDD